MGELVDPQQASMDGLIDWLRQHRRRDPVSPLSKLLKDKAFDEQRIVDIACIDLMERRRMGHAVAVEDYQKEFICIQEESNLLDLIDAEICVASELGENPQSGNYEQRFPTLAVQIAELLRLDAAAECGLRQGMGVGTPAGAFAPHELSASETNADQTNGALRAPSDSADFSIERLPADAAATPTRPREPHPIDLPEWFVGEQCVASSPGRWLIRGRDSVRGVNLALKVTELSPQLTATQGDQILDAAEAAAKVRNPSWVQPSVAAIQNRHLGVIRPWIYARPWLQTRTMENDRDAMRDLAAGRVCGCLGTQNRGDPWWTPCSESDGQPRGKGPSTGRGIESLGNPTLAPSEFEAPRRRADNFVGGSDSGRYSRPDQSRRRSVGRLESCRRAGRRGGPSTRGGSAGGRGLCVDGTEADRLRRFERSRWLATRPASTTFVEDSSEPLAEQRELRQRELRQRGWRQRGWRQR